MMKIGRNIKLENSPNRDIKTFLPKLAKELEKKGVKGISIVENSIKFEGGKVRNRDIKALYNISSGDISAIVDGKRLILKYHLSYLHTLIWFSLLYLIFTIILVVFSNFRLGEKDFWFVSFFLIGACGAALLDSIIRFHFFLKKIILKIVACEN